MNERGRCLQWAQREIGVRRALGASDQSIVRLLLGHGGRQLGIVLLAATYIPTHKALSVAIVGALRRD
ncbi:MAG TPA: hypothetical protein VFI91_08945 [Longimicrobiaceae bacterium]|nr:hypothetical protein [Longimicrobiaceae bacterium]